MNNENEFWSIITNANKDRDILYQLLSVMNMDELIEFQSSFVDFSAELQDEPYTNYMEGSEDGIEDIANWIVSQGKEFYCNIMKHPEQVPYSVENNLKQNLYGVADQVCIDKFSIATEIY